MRFVLGIVHCDFSRLPVLSATLERSAYVVSLRVFPDALEAGHSQRRHVGRPAMPPSALGDNTMFRFHSAADARVRARRDRAARSYRCPLGVHYRKRHPLDCGKADCAVCHGDKVYGAKSRQALRSDVAYREGLDQV